MAVNPQLTQSAYGEWLPNRFQGETAVLGRTGIEIDVDGIDGNRKWKAKGALYLSDVRMVFVSAGVGRGGEIQAFDIPLAYIHKEDFKQPIFGCNHLTGKVWPAVIGGGPAGALPPIDFKVYFLQGGVGTFLRLFQVLLSQSRAQHRRRPVEQQAVHPPPSAPAPPTTQLVSTAFVDPNDPSTLFLTQPVPESNVVPGPRYDENYQLPAV
ncbi:hypothetical protein BSKO_10505 [Bryopsis sp. KO-2023]|nr:hypothetical protein BSKO_10505 [Bryopsis sp. KO-2023]